MSLRIRMLLASAAVVLVVVPSVVVAGAGTGGATDDDAQLIAAAKRTESAIIAAVNDKKWDELRALYSEDAVLLPPNHEPIEGGTPSSNTSVVSVTLPESSTMARSICV